MSARYADTSWIAAIALRLLKRGRAEFSLDVRPPVPVELIAEIVLGLRIDRETGCRLSGELYPVSKLVVVDSSETLARQRYTIAHEIGHFLLHTSGDSLPHQRGRRTPNWKREREADVFAANLLMPLPIFKEEAYRFRDSDNRDEWASKLAGRFEVSRAAARVRLEELLEPKIGIRRLIESTGLHEGGEAMEYTGLLREVGAGVNISSLANQGRAAIKQVLEGLRSPNEVRSLVERGLKACDLLESYADAEAASKASNSSGLDLFQLKAYDAYEPLRGSGEPFTEVKANVAQAREALRALLKDNVMALECRKTMDFFAKVAQPYQEAAARALVQARKRRTAIDTELI
jgi:hypothetical protein